MLDRAIWRRLCTAWGAVSLSVLIGLQAGVWPERLAALVHDMDRWQALKEANTILLLPGVLVSLLASVWFMHWLAHTVPLASRRQAALQPRSLGDFVPPAAQVAVYGVIACALLAWGWTRVTGRASGPETWAQPLFVIVMTVVFGLFARYSVRRPPNMLDRIVGPQWRVREVRFGFFMQLWPAGMSLARLSFALNGTRADQFERLSHLLLVVLIIGWAFWLLRPSRAVTTAIPAGRTAASRTTLVAVAVAMGAGAPALAQPGPVAPGDAAIARILAERIDVRRQGAGIVVGIIEPSGRRVIAHGFRQGTGSAPLDGGSIFELASVTKTVTGLLLADAVRRGEAALSDPVAAFLPGGVRVPERGGRRITLLDLATHTSGLPREPANLTPADPANPFADYSVAQLYAFLAGDELTRDIGAQFEYSNLGAGLLGHALARRAGVDYETLVRTRIAEPLGMTDTAVALSPAMQARLAVGHNRYGEAVPNWDSPTLAGAGALRSAANDMLRLLAAALGYTESPLTRAFALMREQRRATSSPTFHAGLGWGILQEHGTEILFSNGRSGGYRTWLGIEPGTRRGVVVLANGDSDVAPDDIGRHLLNAAFPLQSRFPPPLEPRRETVLPSQVLDRYTGQYQVAPAVQLNVTRLGARLVGHLTGQPPFEMFAESEGRFFLKSADLELVFEREAGPSSAVLLQSGGAVQRAPRADGTQTMPAEVSLAPAVIDRYVGRYQVAPAVTLTITRQSSRVLAQITGQAAVEIFASGEREFFYKVVDARLTFEVDAEGQTTAVTLHQGGADVHAPRLQ